MEKIFFWFVVIIAISGCASSKITSSWKAKNIAPKPYNKILVLGLINEPDRTIREKMEQHIVGDLKELGYNAVCSCDEFNPAYFENMDEKKALEMLKGGGVDAILTIVLLDKLKEKYYVPGRIDFSPYSIYQHRFYGYYHTMYNRVYSPGYYVTDTKYFWESNFYTKDGKELLYSAQSQSFDPSSTASMSHEYGKMIINDMVKSKVLASQRGGNTKAY